MLLVRDGTPDDCVDVAFLFGNGHSGILGQHPMQIGDMKHAVELRQEVDVRRDRRTEIENRRTLRVRKMFGEPFQPR